MSARAETLLWLAQRASAGVLGVAVAVHLATIVFAVRGGLTAAEVMARLRGNGAWLAFYVAFVLAAAVHAPIGLRTVAREWTPLSPGASDWLAAAAAVLLLAMGLSAVFGLYGGGAS